MAKAKRGRPRKEYYTISQEQKEVWVVRAVKLYDNAHEAVLVRLITKRHGIVSSKNTAIKILKDLADKEILVRFKHPETKRVHYHVAEIEDIDSAQLTKSMWTLAAIVNAETQRLEIDYSKTSLEQKFVVAKWLLQMAFGTIKGIALCAATSDNPETTALDKENVQLRKNISAVLRIVKNDKDGAIIYPLIKNLLVNPPRYISKVESDLPHVPIEHRL